MFAKSSVLLGACVFLATGFATATNFTSDVSVTISSLSKALAFAMVNATDCDSCFALLGH
jgi:hypothetical protein